ncbi:putative tail fiber protein [Erwinia phage vB_EamM_Stratton]|uniref:Putative tail fiber protein n=1 Tax=Erwinia phage vB_EamM_Stratton TaxID=1883378 RepID=A0A1B2IHE1_9CAUD|nr:putative tail fiber protein [Erwinia phage vB_EamM_Stratton]
MAKKGRDDFDDLDLDRMDDWDDFGEPPRNTDKSRNPIMDTLRVARKSALSTIWPKGKRDQVILKGLPKPAADAYDGYQNVAAAGKDIVAHTKDELVKTERMIKQQARQLGPTLKRYLPDAMTRKIDKWAKSDQVEYNNYDPKQAMMDRELGEVFGGGGPTEEQQRDMREVATEDRIRDSVQQMKSDAMFQTVIGIAKDISLTTSLHRGVFLNVQRKQLELQYRTLFALQDLAKLKQDEFDRNTPALEAIQKNTALPDYAKEEFSEVHWANVKRKAAEWINPLKHADGFIDQIRENAKKKISNAFGEGRGMLEQLLGMGVEDDFGMDDSSSLTAEKRKTNARDKTVGWGSGWLAKKLLGPQIEKLQKWSREELEKNPEVMKRLQAGKFNFQNLSSISNSAIAGESEGPLADIFRFLNEMGIVQPLNREKAFLDERDGAAMQRSAKFDRKAHLTLTEIIPAWLSEINKSIRRGYGEHADMEYDITSRGFVDRKVIGNRVRKAVANDEQRLRLQGSINKTVDFIDDKGELSAKERQHLADYVESRASQGRAFDVGAILKDSSHLMRHMGGNGSEKLQGILQRRSEGLTGGHAELSNELASRIATIQSSITARQSMIDEAANIYGERALRDAGIFNYDAKSDVFAVDKDLSDPYTLFNNLAMGKTRTGRALTRDQEIAKKLQNGSALGDYLRRMGAGSGGPADDDTSLPPGLGGKGKGKGGKGLNPRQLAAVLYGETSTNFVELLSQRNQAQDQSGQTDRIVAAIRESSNLSVVQKILEHVKSMDEEGVLLASLAGGGGPGGEGSDDIQGPPRPPRGGPGGGGRRRRIIIGEDGLLRRWGGVLFDSAAGMGRFAGRLGKGAKDRLGKFGSWARGKFGGGEGPGILSKIRGLVTGGFEGAWNSASGFVKGTLGIRDIFDEKGNVVLQGAKLEAGEYYQVSSGSGAKMKQLKSLDDIRLGRDIVDEAGNLILAAADLAKAGKLRYYKGGKAQALFQILAQKAGTGLNKIVKLPKRLLDFISPKAGSFMTKVKDWLNEIPEGEEKSRIQAAFSRVTSLPKKVWDAAKNGWDKFKDMAQNNPLTRWWQNREGGGGGISLFSMSNARKTNHILIRIYKLLNKRLAGEAEDEGWTEQMEKNVGGGKGLRGQAAQALRRAKVMARRRFGKRWGRFRGRVGDGMDTVRDEFGNVVERGNNIVDSFRGSRHDIATRYEVARRLAGRDDDVADFYRDHLNARGGISGKKVKSAIKDDVDKVKGAAADVIGSAADKSRSLGSRLLDRMSRMVDLQEMSWFNTMRDSVEKAGGSDGLLRTMFSKFGRRNKPKESDEKRDYFSFFRRRRRTKEEEEAAAPPKRGGKKGGIMDMLKGLPLIGPIVSILGTVGSILGTVAKWGIFKPAALVGKAAWQVGKFAVTRAIPAVATGLYTAASAVVAAVGWPAIAIGAAVVGASWLAYHIATYKAALRLDKMRLAQYGYRNNDAWSSDDGAKARFLEDNIKQYISYDDKGQATLRGMAAKDVEKLAEGYGVNLEEKGEMLAFQAFMLQRFVPVYLRWVTALKSMDNDIQLADVADQSKTSKADQKRLWAKVKMSKDANAFHALTDPRKVNQGFFSKAWDAITFTSPDLLDADEVMKVQDRVGKEIDWLVDDKIAEKKGMREAVDGVKSASVAESTQKLAALDKARNDNTIKTQGWEDGTEQVQIQVDWNAVADKKDLDALESLRWKTYGLVTIDSAARTQLNLFEKEVVKDVDTKSASYKGDWKKAVAVLAPDAIGGPKEDRYKLWFFSRFLPAFMTFLVGVKRYLPAGDPLNLKMTGGYLYEIALLVRGAYNLKGGVRQSVWEIPFNPLGGEANTDPRTVDKELETLRVLSKEADLAVRNLLKETQSAGKRAQWQRRDKNTNFFQTSGDDPQSKFFETYGKGSDAANRANGYAAVPGFNGTPNDLSQSVDAVGGIENYAKMTTGQSGISLGEVQAGDYKSLAEKYPIEKLGRRGALNVQAIQSMIVDAAKMFGVPPAVALAMAKAESSYDYTVTNSAGSAGGLFQFINGTWGDMMKGHGNKFGIPNKLNRNGGQLDPWANTLLGMQFIRDNIASAQRDLGGAAPPPAVAYLYHFLGAGGGKLFLKAWQKNPTAPSARAPGITAAILSGNKGVFYDGQGRNRTIGEVIQELNRRMGAVSANVMSAAPGMTADLTKNLSPANPAVAAGAANDPSIAGAADDLPADNAARRDDALDAKGAQAAADAQATASGNAGPAVPSPGAGTSGGDASTTADGVAAAAAADGLSPTDVAKVKAGAEKQLQKAAQQPAANSSDATATTPTLNTVPVDVQQLNVLKESAGYLKEIRDYMKANPGRGLSTGGNQAQAQGQAPAGSASRQQPITQPAPSLNVQRKVG